MKWLFPAFFIGDQKLSYEIGGGIGWHSMMPSLTQLYPNLLYEDIIQLNYYHNNPAYRRLQMITYIIDRTNPDLSAARNFKWEIRGNITYAENNLRPPVSGREPGCYRWLTKHTITIPSMQRL